MNPEEQIKEINSVLNRVTRFNHISGWAPIWAGVVGLTSYILITYLFRIDLFQMKILNPNFLNNEIISTFYLCLFLGIVL